MGRKNFMDKVSNFLVVKPLSSLTGEPAESGRFEEAELDEEVNHAACFGSFYELDILHDDKVTDNWVAVLDQLEFQATKQTLGESGTIDGQLNSVEASEIQSILYEDENAHSESHGRYISATHDYIRATPVNVADSQTQPILDSTTTDAGGGAPFVGQSAGEITPQRSVTDSTLSVSTHANTSALSKQIVAIISSRDSETLIEVALDPPELGRITIEFEGSQGALNRAILSAESPVTIDLIRRNLDVLARELSIANLGSLDLEMRDFNSDHAKKPPLHTYQHAHSDDDNLSEMSIISIPFGGNGRLDIRR